MSNKDKIVSHAVWINFNSVETHSFANRRWPFYTKHFNTFDNEKMYYLCSLLFWMILNSIFLQAEINNASSMEAIQIDSNDIKRLNTAVTNILNEAC